MRDVSYKNRLINVRSYFKQLFDKSTPLCKLFRTSKKGYLYDIGTNKILACDDIEYTLLEKLIQMKVDQAIDSAFSLFNEDKFLVISESLINIIEKENILSTKKASQFDLSSHFHGFEDLINTSLWILQLEITEKCNLRCEYCVYNPYYPEKRNHGNREMTLDVAFNAMDYLSTHSKNKNKIAVTFYGGEPLLRYSFIKNCVYYARRLFEQKELSFSITTNGTLLTQEMAEFFFDNKFHLTFSIDGPKDIHDDYRKDMRGRGSFEQAITGLKNAVEAFGEYSQVRLLLSMVYAPPWSEEKLNRITELWNELPSLIKRVNAMITYPSVGTIPISRYHDNELSEDKDMITWASEIFEENYLAKKESHPIIKNVLEKRLAKLYQRPIYSKPIDKYHLNGCCIPGVRKIFVTANGDFHICERMPHTAPKIGDAFSGIDIDHIKKIYIDDYSQKSIFSCSTCWAIQHCGVCYALSFHNGKYDNNIKNQYCIAERYSLEKTLILYCKLLEQDQNGLDYLAQMVLE